MGRPQRQVVVNCRQCNHPFSVNARRAERGAFYCSNACYNATRSVYNGSAVYMIRHVPSGRVYIGSTKHCQTRWRLHKSQLKLGRHENSGLQDACDRDGIGAFAFSVLAESDDKEVRLQLEQGYIKEHKSSDPSYGFNLFLDGQTATGYSCSDEARLNMSNAHQDSAARKLSEQQVRHVRQLRKEGMKLTAIARQINAGYEIIQGICAGTRYKRVGLI